MDRKTSGGYSFKDIKRLDDLVHRRIDFDGRPTPQPSVASPERPEPQPMCPPPKTGTR